MNTRILLAVALYVMLSIADWLSAGPVEWGWNLLTTAFVMVMSWFVVEVAPWRRQPSSRATPVEKHNE